MSQLCFRLGIEEQVCRTNALQNHSHRSAMRDRNREGKLGDPMQSKATMDWLQGQLVVPK